MKLKITDNLLVALAALVAVTAAILSVALPANPITFAFAIALVFFLPGYALTRAIFRDKLNFDFFLLLCIGLSVVSTMLISILLAISPIKLTLESILVCLVGLTIVPLVIEKMRNRENRVYDVEIVRPKRDDLDPVIAVSIAFGLILIGIFGYIILTTQAPSTTHVFIKNPDLLPTNITLGDMINLTVQVYNGEGTAAEFGVSLNATNVSVIGAADHVVGMTNGETRDFAFSFAPTTVGYQQFKVEIAIDGKFYGELHFWVTVA